MVTSRGPAPRRSSEAPWSPFPGSTLSVVTMEPRKVHEETPPKMCSQNKRYLIYYVYIYIYMHVCLIYNVIVRLRETPTVERLESRKLTHMGKGFGFMWFASSSTRSEGQLRHLLPPNCRSEGVTPLQIKMKPKRGPLNGVHFGSISICRTSLASGLAASLAAKAGAGA